MCSGVSFTDFLEMGEDLQQRMILDFSILDGKVLQNPWNLWVSTYFRPGGDNAPISPKGEALGRFPEIHLKYLKSMNSRTVPSNGCPFAPGAPNPYKHCRF